MLTDQSGSRYLWQRIVAELLSTCNASLPQVHAEHTVIVRTAMPNSGDSLEWREVSITNRVNVQVSHSTRRLFVQVAIPLNSQTQFLQTPVHSRAG